MHAFCFMQVSERLAELEMALGKALAQKLTAAEAHALCMTKDACNLEYLRVVAWFISQVSVYSSVQVCGIHVRHIKIRPSTAKGLI